MNLSRCATCDAEIVVCDNGVHLDHPAVTYDEARAPWTLIRLGGRVLASVGDPSPEGLGHALHAHQPGDEP